MTPMPCFPPYDGRPAREEEEGMFSNMVDKGDGYTAVAELMLDPELLGTLCRRSRRRLRDIQASCQVVMKLDRVRGMLRMYGPEAAIEAAQRQLCRLGGPRKQVAASLWAELMRTRTLPNSSESMVLHLQELSGCRIHIERSRHEVRIFGPSEGIVVADKLLEELAKQCVEEVVPTGNVEWLSMASLEDMAHALGVTLRLEEGRIVVLGLQGRVAMAAREILKYEADPSRYCMQLSAAEASAISAAWPHFSLDSLDLSELGTMQTPSSATSVSSELAPLAARGAGPQPCRQGGRGAGAAAAPQGASGGLRTVAVRQMQAFEQLGPQAACKPADGHCTVCPTCGVGRFCLFCGEPTWVYQNNNAMGGNAGWCPDQGTRGGGCGRGGGVPGAGGAGKLRQQAAGSGGAGTWPPQRAGAGAGTRPRVGTAGLPAPPAAQLYFGEAPNSGSTRPAAAPAVPQAVKTLDVVPVRAPAAEAPAMSGTQPSSRAYYEAPQCMVGPGTNGMVMGGMVPMCFPMNMAPEQTSNMPWVHNGMPVVTAQGYTDNSGNNNHLMRHVYMVPAYAPPNGEEASPLDV